MPCGVGYRVCPELSIPCTTVYHFRYRKWNFVPGVAKPGLITERLKVVMSGVPSLIWHGCKASGFSYHKDLVNMAGQIFGK